MIIDGSVINHPTVSDLLVNIFRENNNLCKKTPRYWSDFKHPLCFALWFKANGKVPFFEKSVKFVLTGSSAQKLKKQGVNLLGGRGRDRSFCLS